VNYEKFENREIDVLVADRLFGLTTWTREFGEAPLQPGERFCRKCKCRDCGGTGRVEAGSFTSDRNDVECPACKGTGRRKK